MTYLGDTSEDISRNWLSSILDNQEKVNEDISDDWLSKILEKKNQIEEINKNDSNFSYLSSGIVGTVTSHNTISTGIKNIESFKNLSNKLSNLNTKRGGTKGFKGFVFEELHATSATIKGQVIQPLNNNGIADFAIRNTDGTISYAQAKIGYNGKSIDFSSYNGQTIIVDKGNNKLINQAKEAGLNVLESDISLVESTNIAKKMQIETKITGNKHSVIVPKINTAANIAKESHSVGVKTAVKGGQFGCGFSLGLNFVDVACKDKNIDEAIIDVTIDSAVSAGVGYVAGAGITAVANTAIGTAIGSAITTTGFTLTSTAVGTSIVGTTTAIGSTIAGAVTIAGTAVSGTVVGGTITTMGAALAGTAIGGTFMIVAPFVATGFIAGMAWNGAKRLIWK